MRIHAIAPRPCGATGIHALLESATALFLISPPRCYGSNSGEKGKQKKRGKNKPKIGSIKVVAERSCKCENSIRINSF
jgi:hypothetical protein